MGFTEIIVAAIAFVGTLLGSYFSNQKTIAIQGEQIKGLKEDINRLSERVDKHNNFDRRLTEVETILRERRGEQ